MLDNAAIPSAAAAAAFSPGSSLSGEAGGVASSSVRSQAGGRSGPLALRPSEEPPAVSAGPASRKEPPPKELDAAETGRSAREVAEETKQAEQARLAEFWRPRFDPESLRMFTEVIDPETRDARYTVPPTMKLSEEARREGEALSKKERFLKDSGMIV